MLAPVALSSIIGEARRRRGNVSALDLGRGLAHPNDEVEEDSKHPFQDIRDKSEVVRTNPSSDVLTKCAYLRQSVSLQFKGVASTVQKPVGR